jgi:hypothetical protein
MNTKTSKVTVHNVRSINIERGWYKRTDSVINNQRGKNVHIYFNGNDTITITGDGISEQDKIRRVYIGSIELLGIRLLGGEYIPQSFSDLARDAGL